jgi:CheY-like chemotaxis protein
LFSIRERMKALGGDFELRSRPGEGTTAMLVLPLTAQAAGGKSAELGVRSSELGVVSSESAKSGIPDNSKLVTQQSELGAQHAKVRVLLVDDHAMVRQGLRSILDSYQDITVVGEAADGDEAVALAGRLSPDVIVMDVNMPRMNGIEAIRRIKAHQPGTIVVGLSLSQAGQVEPLLLEAGASRFVCKDEAADRLYEAIITAVRRDRNVE